MIAPFRSLRALPVAEWAEANILLPSLTSLPGPLHLTAPQRSILAAYSDPAVRQITLMTANQVGKSLVLLAILGYHIVTVPRSILLVMPTIAVRDRFFKEKLRPLVNSTPAISRAIKRTASGAIPTDIIEYDRGEIHTAYAGSSTSMESVSAQLVLADEVDGYKYQAEGLHPVDALRSRVSSFGRAGKIVVASTPTRTDASIIAREFGAGSASRWHVPCVYCGHEYTLEWEQVSDEGRLHCPACDAVLTERDRLAAIESGRWIEEQPNAAHKSFQMSQLYSQLVPLSQVVEESERMTRRSFVTRCLGIPFEARALDHLEPDQLEGMYQEDYDGRVSAVTCAVDVQKDRLEYQVVHWTRMRPRVELHSILYRDKERGDKREAWKALARAILPHQPDMLFVDVGAFTEEVRAAARGPLRRFATRKKLRLIRGSTNPNYDGDQSGDLVLKQRNKAHPYDLWLNTNVAKEIVHEWLANDGLTVNPAGVASPPEFSAQLLSEELRHVVRANGMEALRWVRKPSVRNEALDCLVYNLCARNHLGPGYDRQRRINAYRALVANT